MGSNVPPGAAEDPTAPYNEKFKVVEVNISQTLSTTVKVFLSEDADENDSNVLEQAVNEQILLPSECAERESYDKWCVDDFCVCL
jgi:hypothetical protein